MPESFMADRDRQLHAGLQSQHLTAIVGTAVADIGVTLTLRDLCEPRRRRSIANNIWESVLDAFASTDDIDFAYPTTRFYDNRGEGKPGARCRATGDIAAVSPRPTEKNP